MWWDTLSYVFRHTPLAPDQVQRLLAEKHGLPAPDFAAGHAEGLVVVLKRVPEAEREAAVERIAADLEVDPRSNLADRMMSWDEARALVASGLVTMGAHTVTHRNLKQLPLAAARGEIADSKAILERELGTRTDFFAYPFGNPANDYSDEVKAAVREAGFRAAFTVVLGLVRPGDDLFALQRFCESSERWQSPGGRFSRAIFDMYLSGARENLGALNPLRRPLAPLGRTAGAGP
jgi:peptidoglycan/xylan/chitin deacetylase (PgdA/CDA1 family)